MKHFYILCLSFTTGNTMGCAGRFEPTTDITMHVLTKGAFLKKILETLKEMLYW